MQNLEKTLNRNDILQKLSDVYDEERGQNIVELDFVKFLSFSEKKIRFVLEFPAGYKNQEEIRDQCLELLNPLFNEVKISVVAVPKMHQTNSSIQKKSQELTQISGVKKIILILSGKGGVGKSTIAVNIAAEMAKTKKVGLIDADIFGPSIAHMLNCLDYPKLNEQNKIVPGEKFGLKFISMGNLLTQDKATVWRGPMASKAILKMFNEVEWGELDCLIVDMPPGTSDIHITIAENFIIDSSIIVTTPQKIALIDAIKAIDMLRLLEIPIAGIVKNMSFFIDSNAKHINIFGDDNLDEIVQKFSLPIIAEIPLIELIRESCDLGEPAILLDKQIDQYFYNMLNKINLF